LRGETSCGGDQKFELRRVKERYEWGAELIAIYEKEELFWQRRGDNWLLKGDANTSYFQGIANGKKRKGLIKELDEGDNVLRD
jgi:hypothetical protein